MFAVRVGWSPPAEAGLRVIAAHTDSPSLRLKPNWRRDGYEHGRFDVEVYGSALLHTWLDRELSVAGCVWRAESGRLRPRLVDLAVPVARVCSLAVHLDPEVEAKGPPLNRHLHLAPLFALPGRAQSGARSLAKALGLDEPQVHGHELWLYDAQPGTRFGPCGDIIASARLDNLTSCHAALVALQRAAEGPSTVLLALFDHEEVKSRSPNGAESHQLERLFRVVVSSRGRDVALARDRSRLLSVDAGHALHPNHSERHDLAHAPVLGGGPMLKTHVEQRYATDGRAQAELRYIAKKAGISLQEFVNRTDLSCGSTLGPTCAARLGVRTLDVGSPILGMHSVRETGAAADHNHLIRLIGAFMAMEA